MNKYELGIKIDQIKKLAAKKDYAEAAAIAKELNWSKVKDWQSLATAINVQEAVGDYEEARDMAILAYNRNLGGRKLVYKLTEFFIKVGDFENANELYEEYSRTSQHDVSRFILLYDLKKAQNASDNELVGILEDYRDHEIDEKYMYELATLYYKTGRKEECVKTCDNIVLWFQDGRYVEKAVQLKEQLGVTLTKTQKGILEDVKKRKDDIEAAKEELFAKQKELRETMLRMFSGKKMRRYLNYLRRQHRHLRKYILMFQSTTGSRRKVLFQWILFRMTRIMILKSLL